MGEVFDFLANLFGMESWPPRWYCGTWSSFHGWLYIFSNIFIWSAYFFIPFLLILVIRQRPGIPFPKIFYWFGAFILFCGLTHFMDALIFWYPLYRVNAMLLFITAIVSWITIYQSVRILPQIKLIKTPGEFLRELEERKKVEKKLNDILLVTSNQNSRLVNFTQMVSHNLKSHSGNIESLLNLYQSKDDKPQEQVKVLEMLSKASFQLQNTVDNLRDLIDVNANSDKTKSLVNLRETLDSVLLSVTPQVVKTSAQIDNNIARDLNVYGFPAYVESIFLNLVTNSLKYGPVDKMPIISISSSVQESFVDLKFQDNGLGMDLDRYRDKLFGLYQTFHNHPESTGIGLYITKNQIEQLGGSIAVKSKLGEGTTFTIRLPLAV